MSITQNFLAYFHFTSLAFFPSPFFQDWMLHMEIPSTCILTPFFNYQSNVLRQYTKKQRNVFTCYGSLKRTKEKTNIENNEKIL